MTDQSPGANAEHASPARSSTLSGTSRHVDTLEAVNNGHGSSATQNRDNPNPGQGDQGERSQGKHRKDSNAADVNEGCEQRDEHEQVGESDDGDDDDEEEDEEPLLKYTRLTSNLSAVYRNGDATSSFCVVGDKMILGTHNGNIHVSQLLTLQTLRVYHAHTASVTSISVSPYPTPFRSSKADETLQPSRAANRSSPHQSVQPVVSPSRKLREPPLLPKIPSNDVYVATSSIDGNVCVQSLTDLRDVQLRSFARPVQAVVLSPEYKVDRTYLSGGLAGQLVLTIGGTTGRSTSTKTGSATATASGWLGSIGLGHNSGKDTVLHSGEGTISCIKWSLSGRHVVWLNEHGIKIMRSHLHLDGATADHAWKRLGHIDRPHTPEWENMASVWRGRAEWIDEKALENYEPPGKQSTESPATTTTVGLCQRAVERLLVGWGGTIWFIHVHSAHLKSGRSDNATMPGRAEIVKILRLDCIISGISLFASNLLLVLAFCPVDHKDPEGSGIRQRQSNQPPEMRLIDLNTQVETDRDTLSVSRFERLSSADYHMGVLPAHTAASAVASRGALEALAGFGTEMLNAAINPRSLFTSGASVKSRDSGDDGGSSLKAASTTSTIRQGKLGPLAVHLSLAQPGAKIFIHSPYDCILGTKRDLADHFQWLAEHAQYQQAWELMEENPDIAFTLSGNQFSELSASKPSDQQAVEDEGYDDESQTDLTHHTQYSESRKRIGELWIQELVKAGDWAAAGKACGRVLRTPSQWENWVWTFAGADKIQEISDQIPSEPMYPALATSVYDVVLGHLIRNDKVRFRELLAKWPTDLFDITAISSALEKQLQYRDVREDSLDDGERGRDWRIVMESLARLHEANGKKREALKCYIKLQDADSAFGLIRDSHLAEAVTDDVPGFIGLRVPPGLRNQMSQDDLMRATSEAIMLLVDEAQHGLVRSEVIVKQLQDQNLQQYLYFYLRGLWRGEGIKEHEGENVDRLVSDSRSLVDEVADIAFHLFASYDEPLLMEFLKTSTSYSFEQAVQECETFKYYDELVYIYSKTGQMKRALHLLIDRLHDIQKAIEFVKEQDDPDLWEDLLDYSMDKPSFIRALLEQAGTATDPVKLVRRIPEGLEIPGLREGLMHMMKEHELQHMICSGAARVVRGELVAAQNKLRARQRRGIKFEVLSREQQKAQNGLAAAKSADKSDRDSASQKSSNDDGDVAVDDEPLPGRCASCREAFHEFETETILGFACGHVYHLSHLFQMLNLGKDADADLGGYDENRSPRLVGLKVARVRLLKDKVRNGCPICHKRATGDGHAH